MLLKNTQLDILLPTEDPTRHIAAHRRLSSTYCCSQKTQLDSLLPTQDPTRHIAAHRRLSLTYCCPQKTQLDILLLTEDPTRRFAAHTRPNSTYCCSQKTQLDILLLTEDCSIRCPHCAVANSRGTPRKLESAYRTFTWCHRREKRYELTVWKVTMSLLANSNFHSFESKLFYNF